MIMARELDQILVQRKRRRSAERLAGLSRCLCQK